MFVFGETLKTILKPIPSNNEFLLRTRDTPESFQLPTGDIFARNEHAVRNEGQEFLQCSYAVVVVSIEYEHGKEVLKTIGFSSFTKTSDLRTKTL
ncbi:hypothetical protein AVEN_139712-1 [Araneus ventricosus]|uniref:Uncharacterized protein n=1 Tax=Araneus ventricosus TaxID=182803 RepID=A0A4Y2MMJ0_ARAVE|nr:hypothetical protein AVEN_139712-1 [Araneus ventricosus]